MRRLHQLTTRISAAALAATAVVVVAPDEPIGGDVPVAFAVDQKVATSISPNCAVTGPSTGTNAGEVWCWGEKWDGQLGNGTRAFSSYSDDHVNSPARSNAGGAEQVTVGSCALLAGGVVQCWGGAGKIEDGTGSLFSEPPWGSTTPRSYGFGTAEQVAGRCARLVGGTVQCFGWNNFGQLGNGSPGWAELGFPRTPPSSGTAVPVSGLTNVVDIGSHNGGTCAVKADGTVWCWGYNFEGELGNGDSGTQAYGEFFDIKYSTVPVQVIGVTDALKVRDTCAIREGGKVSCWGSSKRIAPGTTGVVTAVEVPQFEGAFDIAGGPTQLCAVLGDGRVLCQGSGALGDGTWHATGGSAYAAGIETAKEIVRSPHSHTCVREVDGSISCWGTNNRGDLGNGTTNTLPPGPFVPQWNQVLSPTRVVGFGGEVEEVDHLRTTLTVDPNDFELAEDAAGEPVPKNVTVTLTIENVSEFEVPNVTAPVTLTTGLVVGEEKLIRQIAGPPEDPTNFGNTSVGTIPFQGTRTVEYTLEVSGDGVYSVEALVLYADPDDASTRRSLAETEVRAGFPAVVNADLHFGGEDPAAKTIDAGDYTSVFLELENTSNTETVTFDRSRLTIEGAAGGGFLTDLLDNVPPVYVSGQVPVPTEIELEPQERLTLDAWVYTAPDQGTRAIITFDRPGTVSNPLTGERPLLGTDVKFADDRMELRLSVLDPPATYGDASIIDVFGSFTVGFIESSGRWLRNTWTGLVDMADAITSGRFGIAVGDALAHAGAFLGTLSTMDPADRDAYITRVAIQVAEAQDRAVESVKASFESHMNQVFDAYYSGNTTQFAELMGGDLATIVWEVGAMEAAASGIVRLAAESRAASQLLRLSREGLRTIQNGTVIGRQAARAFGYQRRLVDDIANFAKRNNLNITIKPRDPDAILVINGRQAKMKPEFIKPKNVNDIDIDVLGFPASSKATVAMRPGIATEIPDLDALRARFNAAKARKPNVYDDSMWEVVVKRYEKRKSEIAKYLEPNPARPGESLSELDGTTVTREFNTVDNGLPDGIGVTTSEKFEIVEIEPGVIEMRLDGKPVTSDVDILSITQSNGLPLSKEQRIAVYKHLEEIADIQHPESATWIREGDGANFGAKREVFEEYSSKDPNNESALQFGGDGNLYAVGYNENSRFVTAEDYLIHWDGGFRADGNIRTPISIDTTGYTSLDAGYEAAGTIALAGSWNGSDSNGNDVPSTQSNDPAAEPYRSGPNGSVEQYQSNGTPRGSDAARGSWTAVPPSTFDGKAKILVLPQTQIVEPVAAGADTVEVFDRPELETIASTGEPLLSIDGFFTVGQTVVIDPGGANEETAVLASVRPFRFTAPLTKPHSAAELVIAVRAKPTPPTPPTPPGPPPTVADPTITPLRPARVFDSRSARGTIDGLGGDGIRRADTTTEIQIAGRGGVPTDATAAAVTVTVVGPHGTGYGTVYDCTTRPNASNLNYTANDVVANAVVTKLSPTGTICVYTSETTQLIVDVNAALPAGTDVGIVTPGRLFDDRSPNSTVDGIGAGGGRRAAGSVTSVQVAGRAGVPAGAAGAVVNATIIGAATGGYASLFACGEPTPNASNVNFAADEIVPNVAVVPLAADGTLCVFTSDEVNLLIDVNAWFGA